MKLRIVRFGFRSLLTAGLLVAGFWTAGCGQSRSQPVTLTFKQDGSHFSGTLVRRDTNSITVSDPEGDTRTFLNSELSDIRYGNPDAAKTDIAAPVPVKLVRNPAALETFQVPAGTVLPVSTSIFLDSCCVKIDDISPGVMDASVKDAQGNVVLPEGASVTFILRDQKVVGGRMTMEFELGSADFNNSHYVISSAKGAQEPGAVVTFSGPKQGTEEALARGTALHLDENTAMAFTAETPVVFKLSE